MTRAERIEKIFENIEGNLSSYMFFASLTDDQVEASYYQIFGIE